MGNTIDRAERYVRGLMDDEERERAERDLEIDPAFRAAMVEIADRIHLFGGKADQPGAPAGQPVDRSAGAAAGDQWRLLKEAIAALPQMRAADAQPGIAGQDRATPDRPMPDRPATFGRRKTDWPKRMIAPAAIPSAKRLGLRSAPGRRAVTLALCLIAAFALGYAVGRL